MKKYQPQQFEDKWIEQWDKEKTYKTGLPFTDHRSQPINSEPSTVNREQKKMYVLDMFPYPSGAGLHVGHPRGYTATDILSRYYRMNNYAVLHPMGWDAFGLPAENAAIKAKKNPKEMVPLNIANFKRQMKMLGLSYDWEREFDTTDPSYYKWTQWLFIQFFKMGLLYKTNTPVYYCEFCKTGLAEEEVLPNGLHERCNNPITRKELPQWIFKITAYADRLLSDLDGLDWPSGILEMQRNWIGRKEGINITYEIKGRTQTVTCFTTTPVNFGATFIVIAPEHPLVQAILKDKNTTQEYSTAIKEYIDSAISKTDLERQSEEKKKTGVFTGLYAINHLNGEEIPIWIADFVLASVGTGAVQGCPGHDERDFEFAKKFKLPIKRVVTGPNGETGEIASPEQVIAKGSKGKMVNSEFLNGMEFVDAMEKTKDYFEEKGWGKRVVSYHLRDWIFSRQRYWGEPTPMVFCQHCADQKISWWDTDAGKAFQKEHQKISKLNKDTQESLYGWFPIEEKSLPLELPYLTSYEPGTDGGSPLAGVSDWVETECPVCGKKARRETDTMPNWAGSCWYFIAFAFWNQEIESTKERKVSFENWKLKIENSGSWLPVDWYFGGAEHAVLHLLYSRFWIKALYDLGLVTFKEPFLRLRNVGMILATDHRKMSKSWGNVINPDDVVKEYGADALRVYEMFMAPFSQEIAWSTDTLQGSYRFLNRIWNLSHKEGKVGEHEDKKMTALVHKTIKKVSADITDIKFNTAIAAMMEFLNEWDREGAVLSKESLRSFLKILAPFAPFLAEELWRGVLGDKTSIHLSPWPAVDENLLVEEEKTIPVQVNGKVRATIRVPADKDNEEYVLEKALQDTKVQSFIQGKDYKAIYIHGRILNLVVR